MNTRHIAIISWFIIGSIELSAQVIKLDKNNLQPVGVFTSVEKLDGRQVVRVVRDSGVKAADQPTFVKIKGVEFKDGIIEVDLLSKLLPNAGASARGFIGVGFRISGNNAAFECIYIRPTNGRADDQLRRNHATQYFSYPDYLFDRLRKEAPGVYESYADMGLNEWIKFKLVVRGNTAKLYLHGNSQPSLIVNDLKLGADSSGEIGLWVDGGTDGFFSDLKVSK
jgi:hypothetical protein